MRVLLLLIIFGLFATCLATAQVGIRLKPKNRGSRRDRTRAKQPSRWSPPYLASNISLVNASARLRLQARMEAQKSKFEMNLLPDMEHFNVSVNMNVYCIFGLDDKEVMEMSGWIGVSWMDDRFTWEPSEWENITTLEMSSDNVWLPDVGIWNAKEPENADLRAKAVRTLIIKPTGIISMFLPLLVNIPCPINSILFPFDQQICRLKLGTVNSPRSYYQLLLGTIDFDKAQKLHVGEWRPIGYRRKLTSTYYAAGDTFFDVFDVDIILSRKPLYHIVLVIIPFVLLTVIALVMFLAQEAGDRVSISIAVVLAMTLYVMITSQNAPKSMTDIPLLGMYLMVQMGMLIVFTFVAVISAIAPIMAEGEGKRIWKFLKVHQRRFDLLAFLVYFLLTIVNSVICLIIIPNSSVKLTA